MRVAPPAWAGSQAGSAKSGGSGSWSRTVALARRQPGAATTPLIKPFFRKADTARATPTGVEPQVIWRVKYFHAGDWDGAGAAQAFTDYMAGLHRRAYGSTLWCARFGSGSEAAQAAPKIAAAAKLARSGDRWTGSQPAYGFAAATAENPSPGPLTLWQQGAWLLLSTLPDADTEALRAPIAAGGGK